MRDRWRDTRWLLALLGLYAPVWLAGCRPSQIAEPRPQSDVVFSPTDRILILAPHPDDEVIGCGGIIQQAVAMGLPVRIVFFTYGDNNQWSFLLYRKRPALVPRAVRGMGLVRHDEALAAARTLGLSADHLTFLGYPDFGTLHIWDDHWGDQPPFRSMLTRATAVPYHNALRPGAAYKGEEVLHDLTTVLREFRPTKVFLSHPGDYMPDHRALYLFTRVALWDLEREMTPAVYPYLVHFQRWPKPSGYRPAKLLEPPTALKPQILWQSYRLTRPALDRKQAALKAHRTQYGYSARYLLSFVRPNELFGDFPVVVLRQGPAALHLSDGTRDVIEAPEELTEQERATFVGFEERSIQLEDGDLVLSFRFSRPLAQAVEGSVYIFGYRADRPFATMPKLHVKFGVLTHAIYDQDRKLPHDVLRVSRTPRELTVRVPLHALGNPQRILTSARTYLGEVPLDWVSWRVLELSDGSGGT